MDLQHYSYYCIMGSHPVNLAVRFLLELAALAALAAWGWKQPDGSLRFFLAIGLPVLAAVIWGTFAVPEDPSRSGNAPVPVPGPFRLIIELIIFGSGICCLWDLGYTVLCLITGGMVLLHYAFSYDRVLWLIKTR